MNREEVTSNSFLCHNSVEISTCVVLTCCAITFFIDGNKIIHKLPRLQVDLTIVNKSTSKPLIKRITINYEG